MNDMDICKKMVNIVASGKSRNIEVNLKFSTLKKVMKSKRCFFTGELLNFEQNHPHQHTIDRLDNDKGYVDGNIVACTKEFNSIKGSLTLKQITILYNSLETIGLI